MRRLRVHVERRPMLDELDVYIGEVDESGGTVYRWDGGAWRAEGYAAGALPAEPSLRLPVAFAELLAPELLEIARPSTAQGRHLDDAVAVRDRLLAMVERMAA